MYSSSNSKSRLPWTHHGHPVTKVVSPSAKLNGAILKHSVNQHREKITRKKAEESLKVRYRENHQERLEILEALMIMFEKPEINKQDTGKARILTLFQ